MYAGEGQDIRSTIKEYFFYHLVTLEVNNMPTAYGYARVSTNRQAAQGTSLDNQAKRIWEYYSKELRGEFGWGDVFAETHGVSAYKVPLFKRPAGKKLLGVLGKGDLILVNSVDRVFRSLVDLIKTQERLKRLGANLLVINFEGMVLHGGTPGGEMIFELLAVVAKAESRMRSQRMIEAHACRPPVKHVNQPRFGYRRTSRGRYERDPGMLEYCRRVWEMRYIKKMKMYDIRDILEEEVCKNKGIPFNKYLKWRYNIGEKHATKCLKFYQEFLDEKSR